MSLATRLRTRLRPRDAGEDLDPPILLQDAHYPAPPRTESDPDAHLALLLAQQRGTADAASGVTALDIAAGDGPLPFDREVDAEVVAQLAAVGVLAAEADKLVERTVVRAVNGELSDAIGTANGSRERAEHLRRTAESGLPEARARQEELASVLEGRTKTPDGAAWLGEPIAVPGRSIDRPARRSRSPRRAGDVHRRALARRTLGLAAIGVAVAGVEVAVSTATLYVGLRESNYLTAFAFALVFVATLTGGPFAAGRAAAELRAGHGSRRWSIAIISLAGFFWLAAAVCLAVLRASAEAEKAADRAARFQQGSGFGAAAPTPAPTTAAAVDTGGGGEFLVLFVVALLGLGLLMFFLEFAAHNPVRREEVLARGVVADLEQEVADGLEYTAVIDRETRVQMDAAVIERAEFADRADEIVHLGEQRKQVYRAALVRASEDPELWVVLEERDRAARKEPVPVRWRGFTQATTERPWPSWMQESHLRSPRTSASDATAILIGHGTEDGADGSAPLRTTASAHVREDGVRS